MNDIPSLTDIRAAEARIRPTLAPTPFLHSRTLSDILGCELWLKFENLNFTASFKERGALNKLLQLTPEERERGVVAVSAGNHALGLAYHARRVGVKAVIVMPETAPAVKVMGVRDCGAEVILHGKTFADAAERIPALIAERGLVLVHPFDDAAVIAGQGTVGLEMLAQVSAAGAPPLDLLVIPVGGGGLIGGIATVAKALQPNIKVIGVQTELYSGMAQVLDTARIMSTGGPSLAEGIAVKEPGLLTREIVRRHVDDMLVVSEPKIEDAVVLLLEVEKTLTEGAGAAGIAAISSYPNRFKGKRVGTVLCGGNIDMQLLSTILQRSLVRRGRLVRFTVTTLDAAGQLADIAAIIAHHGGNIVEVWHDRVFGSPLAKTTAIDIEFELQNPQARQLIEADLRAHGMGVVWRHSPV
ncbi:MULTISPECIES: threonine ammonia-lyase [unclassified Beijerinckia]|uniref:threonine ammonia-lyase n=1 Tax=unclassified Beijerinckia TaxID=2638183 RepID=UPI000894476B|nr:MULTISPECIES: threonine ammonia-lyase [unclassified Beijerinckia]MDH7798444.1 threonine dehydratase [Beijerinckia sp. GAS462]SED21097.1 threonine dehydratase [Beijerinckia sp. 28-YEA-48]